MTKIKSSSLILMNGAREVLLGRRPLDSKSRGGQLDFFGGRRNPGESALAAMIREVNEETQLDVADLNFAHVYQTKHTDGPQKFVRDYFYAQIPEFPEITVAEHTGSVVLPAMVALDALIYDPHRMALTRTLSFAS